MKELPVVVTISEEDGEEGGWDFMLLSHPPSTVTCSKPQFEARGAPISRLPERKIMEGSGGDGSPQSSMCMVKAAELFPKPTLEKEEETLCARFVHLDGESVRYLGGTDDGILALSNYRLFLQKSSTGAEVSVPLGLIESTQVRDLFHLIINCKDASTVKCSFATSEQCSEWHRRITLSIGVPETLEALFAFPFHAWASESPTLNQDNEWAGRLQRDGSLDDDFRREAERLQFDLQGAWRISQANADFKLCPSYPRLLLVPACISDDTLQNVASFRSSRRIPAVVWRHQRTGAVIARCSQPEVGWLGWRNSKDEQLLKALSDACSFDRGTQDRGSDGTRTVAPARTRHSSEASTEGSISSPPASPEGSHEEVEMDEPKKILIVDARSYTSAVTNRARGGGCECAEYYPSAEIQFMSLGNIHVIRKSFHALRQLCASQADIPNWLGLLERTLWLQHLSGLLAASMVVCHAIERNGRPVLVHCSDGWDRTPQIVATAQLCLDPYYRTIEGFRVLVEREWLSFGHKFADRCGHGPGSDETNERCPVFLQWLDCVHQIHRQFPCSFEFDMGYLIKLAQHSHSCLFGTFLCNTVKERQENSVPDRTFSVWPFLSGPIYKNHLYVPNRERVLWPAHNVRDLRLWTEVYLGSWGGGQQQPSSSEDYPGAALTGPSVTAVPIAASTGGDSSTAGDGGDSGSLGPVVNGTGPGQVAAGSAAEQNGSGSMTKTRSYSDIKEAINGPDSANGGAIASALARRSSDPNMTVDSSILSATSNHLMNQEESSNDSNFSSDREASPDPMLLLSGAEHHNRLLLSHPDPRNNATPLTTSSTFSIQHATQTLQSLTRELNQSDEDLENGILRKRPNGTTVTPLSSSSLFANGAVHESIVSVVASAAAAAIIPTATSSIVTTAPSSSSVVDGEESSYRFQPIVPELPTELSRGSPRTRCSPSSSPLIDEHQHQHQQRQLQCSPRHHRLAVNDIDENTSRIIKIESYRSTIGNDVPDGGGGGGGNLLLRATIGRPVASEDDLMMESVDLSTSTSVGFVVGGGGGGGLSADSTIGASSSPNGLETSGTTSSLSQNLWHGSIETSTDTLVPMDQYQPQRTTDQHHHHHHHHHHRAPVTSHTLSDVADEEVRSMHEGRHQLTNQPGMEEKGASIRIGGLASGSSNQHQQHAARTLTGLIAMNGGEGNRQPPVLTDVPKDDAFGDYYTAKTQTDDSNGCDFNSDSQNYDRQLSNQSSSMFSASDRSYVAGMSVASGTGPIDHPSLDRHVTDDRGGGGTSRVDAPVPSIASQLNPSNDSCKARANNSTTPPPSMLSSMMMAMDESIIIQPQFQQLEINGNGGKHHGSTVTTLAADGGGYASSTAATAGSLLQQQQLLLQQKERRRRHSSNSKADLMSPIKPTNGSISPSATHSRFSTPGARSLPLTPPSVPYAADRPPVATFSCPDGLAHALSEQNLRLQQIVYEHRQREEALQRELYATRLALLKKTCQHCCSSSVQQHYGNEDPMVDSMNENASNCSWEAVDDRSAPSSGANSSQQMQYSSSGVGTSASVLWVPDHAVTRCTSCQMEFTLCRRKHHCRSCGQIFCAECSEYTAHLPDERFYQPVRLCGPCYQRISTITMATTTSSNSVPSVQHQYPSSSSYAASGSQTHGGGAITTSSMSLANGGSAFHSQRTLLAGGHPLHSLAASECKQQAVNGTAAGGESGVASRVSDVACCKANATATASN
ncbi:myotubularin-related protein 4-like isoform X4 [Anopheles albimanus]|uniref:myotubularin-related protein 4-like isoform X4 n=1 Tax=Anopheles albimanus TaxID=7167 RepID=UPI00163E0569|nr:myotubularin-related protein 4-like isoform X4 [Anopheles albimanus]